jgi:hypothetical protein
MSPSESILSSKPNDAAVRAKGWERVRKRLGAALYIALCVEIGVFLLLMPWSAIWSRSLLLGHYPLIRPLLMSPYLRGAVSGLGLVNLWLGVSQAWGVRNPASR